MIDATSTALSGLNAASRQVETAASNIANSTTTSSLEDSTAVGALETAQSSLETGGVQSGVIPKSPGIIESFAPNSPFANSEGLVGSSNVNLAEEAINLKLAETAYKANVSTLKAVNEINDALLDIFDDD